jgi:hypothetical protein
MCPCMSSSESGACRLRACSRLALGEVSNGILKGVCIWPGVSYPCPVSGDDMAEMQASGVVYPSRWDGVCTGGQVDADM